MHVFTDEGLIHTQRKCSNDQSFCLSLLMSILYSQRQIYRIPTVSTWQKAMEKFTNATEYIWGFLHEGFLGTNVMHLSSNAFFKICNQSDVCGVIYLTPHKTILQELFATTSTALHPLRGGWVAASCWKVAHLSASGQINYKRRKRANCKHSLQRT